MPKLSFGFKRPEDSPGFLLWQVTTTWQREIKAALEPYSITHPQFVIMALLLWFTEQGMEPIQSVIIEKSKLDKMTVSGSIKKLVAMQFVKRDECKHDTRAKVVRLTQKGVSLTQKLVSTVELIDKTFFSNISQPDRQHLLNILLKLATS